MVLLGALTNGVAILIGSLLGLFFGKLIPEKMNTLLMQGLGLCVIYVGISSSLVGENTMVTILSIVIGGIIGQAIDIDDKLNRFGNLILGRFQKDNSTSSVAQGFVNTTLFVCVGAMAIVGSMQSGLSGNHEILFAKSLIDGLVALVMASTMGIGVCFAAGAVFVYEGILTLSASAIAGYLITPVVNEMTCVGSLLIIGIGLNMLKVTDIKVSNFLLAPFIPIVLGVFF
ncbi:MAG: DUF554 domain-containing protein [Clostridiales bacterium]|jgi:uncharacterized membrane protein YqgA involved in biofilm formation|nr:DUF554 domain-containing protein [Clostridiales bacterium]